MATGTVKWFDKKKGYGFIEPTEGGKDVFVHVTAVEQSDMDEITEGMQLSYDLVEVRGREAAGNLELLNNSDANQEAA